MSCSRKKLWGSLLYTFLFKSVLSKWHYSQICMQIPVINHCRFCVKQWAVALPNKRGWLQTCWMVCFDGEVGKSGNGDCHLRKKKMPSRRTWGFTFKVKYSPLQNEHFAMARHLHVPVSRFSKLCLYFVPIALAQSPCHSNPCNDHFWNIYTPCLAGWLLLTQ